MKVDLELNVVDDKTYVNFWDWKEGKDVVGELQDDGTLIVDGQSMTMKQFVDRVLEVVKSWPEK